MQTTLTDLPEELIIHILRQDPYCWAPARKTCTRLYALVNDTMGRYHHSVPRPLTAQIHPIHMMLGLGRSMWETTRSWTSKGNVDDARSINAIAFYGQNKLLIGGACGGGGFIEAVDEGRVLRFDRQVTGLRAFADSLLVIGHEGTNAVNLETWKVNIPEGLTQHAALISEVRADGAGAMVVSGESVIRLARRGEKQIVIPHQLDEAPTYRATALTDSHVLALAEVGDGCHFFSYRCADQQLALNVPVGRFAYKIESDGAYALIKHSNDTHACLINLTTGVVTPAPETRTQVFLSNAHLIMVERDSRVVIRDLSKDEPIVLREADDDDWEIEHVAFEGWKLAFADSTSAAVEVWDMRVGLIHNYWLDDPITCLKIHNNVVYAGQSNGRIAEMGIKRPERHRAQLARREMAKKPRTGDG